MEFKEFLSKFIEFNKRIFKKLILICILFLYFTFLIFYNYFRLSFNYSLESSWLFGMIFALISTLILVFLADILRVLYLIKSGREL